MHRRVTWTGLNVKFRENTFIYKRSHTILRKVLSSAYILSRISKAHKKRITCLPPPNKIAVALASVNCLEGPPKPNLKVEFYHYDTDLGFLRFVRVYTLGPSYMSLSIQSRNAFMASILQIMGLNLLLITAVVEISQWKFFLGPE